LKPANGLKLFVTRMCAALRHGSMNALYIGKTVSLTCWMTSPASWPERWMSRITCARARRRR
jgi:hypothetical protein